MSEYQPELNKAFELARGSGLGGTSRINSLLYTRGLQKEYDLWAESGCEGWAWRDVERFFKKSENFLDGRDEENVHGKTGEILKSELVPISDSPAYTLGEWTNRSDPALYFPAFSRLVEYSPVYT
jgi:choline dehydrogenase-like flavoprotein